MPCTPALSIITAVSISTASCFLMLNNSALPLPMLVTPTDHLFFRSGPALHFRPSDGVRYTWEKVSLQQFFVIFRIEKWCKFFSAASRVHGAPDVSLNRTSMAYSLALECGCGKIHSCRCERRSFVQQNSAPHSAAFPSEFNETIKLPTDVMAARRSLVSVPSNLAD